MFVARIIRNDGYILDRIGIKKPFRELDKIREKCREVMISKARAIGYDENQAHDCLHANIYETSPDTPEVALIDTVRLLEEDKVYVDDEEGDDDWDDEDEDEDEEDNHDAVAARPNDERIVEVGNYDGIVTYEYPWGARPAQDPANVRVAQHDGFDIRANEDFLRRMADVFGVRDQTDNR